MLSLLQIAALKIWVNFLMKETWSLEKWINTGLLQPPNYTAYNVAILTWYIALVMKFMNV